MVLLLAQLIFFSTHKKEYLKELIWIMNQNSFLYIFGTSKLDNDWNDLDIQSFTFSKKNQMKRTYEKKMNIFSIF